MLNPKIFVYTGPMYAGKSTGLINAFSEAKKADRKVVAIKPNIDNRYTTSTITTHDRKEIPAEYVRVLSTFLNQEEWKEIDFGADVFLVDEAQFFKKNIVEFVCRLRNVGKEVHIAGLDMDFRGNSFGYMPDLMTLANKVIKFQAQCAECKLINATMTYRKAEINDDGQILVGGNEVYESRCFNCWKP
jgi:thymidine kinase